MDGSMSGKIELERQLDSVKGHLYELIDRKGSLTDDEVVEMSSKLDHLLNMYSELI